MLPNLVSFVVFRFSVPIKNITKGKSKLLDLRIVQRGFNTHTNSRAQSTSSASSLRDKPTRHVRYPKIMKGELKTSEIHSDHYKDLFTPELITLSKLFSQNEFELRMAGGAVRDLLMDLKPADVDFATTATPDEMKEMFEREGIRMINMKGEKHGTITARLNDKENFEITTLRIDVSTDGRHAEVEFTKNWELDAGRRDLTINSMFLDFNGVVYDYYTGIEDVENRVVRFVGDPSDRIQEDYLRILRYFRFYGRISPHTNAHDLRTMNAIRENMGGLKQISGERIWTELRKIMTGNHATELMCTMLELGLGEYIGLPQQPNIEEYRMLQEKLKVLNLQVNPITSLCSVLGDEKDGLNLHGRLKLSAFERDLCLFVIEHRGRKSDSVDNADGGGESTPSIRPYQTIALLSNHQSLLIIRSYIEEVLKYNGDVDLLKQFQEWDAPKFPINGHMMMERGIKGRLLGAMMTELKMKWIASNFTLTKEELFLMIPQLKEDLAKQTTPTKKRNKN